MGLGSRGIVFVGGQLGWLGGPPAEHLLSGAVVASSVKKPSCSLESLLSTACHCLVRCVGSLAVICPSGSWPLGRCADVGAWGAPALVVHDVIGQCPVEGLPFPVSSLACPSECRPAGGVHAVWVQACRQPNSRHCRMVHATLVTSLAGSWLHSTGQGQLCMPPLLCTARPHVGPSQ